MDRLPVPPRKRKLLEAAIRSIDLIVYAAVFFAGIYAVIATPSAATEALEGYEWLVYVWSALLLIGGLVGFAGRLLRRWMVGTPATVASVFGVAMYLVMVLQYATQSVATMVAATMIVVALMAMGRRWLELQIFATEPGDFHHRLAQAFARRTQNVVPRDRP